MELRQGVAAMTAQILGRHLLLLVATLSGRGRCAGEGTESNDPPTTATPPPKITERVPPRQGSAVGLATHRGAPSHQVRTRGRAVASGTSRSLAVRSPTCGEAKPPVVIKPRAREFLFFYRQLAIPVPLPLV
ncbi:hypothetical protein NL676_003925 [Syzygium grande]|nr:hypothetical protein NL676_003925 [Syzygium grande]